MPHKKHDDKASMTKPKNLKRQTDGELEEIKKDPHEEENYMDAGGNPQKKDKAWKSWLEKKKGRFDHNDAKGGQPSGARNEDMFKRLQSRGAKVRWSREPCVNCGEQERLIEMQDPKTGNWSTRHINAQHHSTATRDTGELNTHAGEICPDCELKQQSREFGDLDKDKFQSENKSWLEKKKGNEKLKMLEIRVGVQALERINSYITKPIPDGKGGRGSFQQCINNNKDKRSPGGYCKHIEMNLKKRNIDDDLLPGDTPRPNRQNKPVKPGTLTATGKPADKKPHTCSTCGKEISTHKRTPTKPKKRAYKWLDFLTEHQERIEAEQNKINSEEGDSKGIMMDLRQRLMNEYKIETKRRRDEAKEQSVDDESLETHFSDANKGSSLVDLIAWAKRRHPKDWAKRQAQTYKNPQDQKKIPKDWDQKLSLSNIKEVAAEHLGTTTVVAPHAQPEPSPNTPKNPKNVKTPEESNEEFFKTGRSWGKGNKNAAWKSWLGKRKAWEKDTECPNCKKTRPDHREKCPTCGATGYDRITISEHESNKKKREKRKGIEPPSDIGAGPGRGSKDRDEEDDYDGDSDYEDKYGLDRGTLGKRRSRRSKNPKTPTREGRHRYQEKQPSRPKDTRENSERFEPARQGKRPGKRPAPDIALPSDSESKPVYTPPPKGSFAHQRPKQRINQKESKQDKIDRMRKETEFGNVALPRVETKPNEETEGGPTRVSQFGRQQQRKLVGSTQGGKFVPGTMNRPRVGAGGHVDPKSVYQFRSVGDMGTISAANAKLWKSWLEKKKGKLNHDRDDVKEEDTFEEKQRKLHALALFHSSIFEDSLFQGNIKPDPKDLEDPKGDVLYTNEKLKAWKKGDKKGQERTRIKIERMRKREEERRKREESPEGKARAERMRKREEKRRNQEEGKEDKEFGEKVRGVSDAIHHVANHGSKEDKYAMQSTFEDWDATSAQRERESILAGAHNTSGHYVGRGSRNALRTYVGPKIIPPARIPVTDGIHPTLEPDKRRGHYWTYTIAGENKSVWKSWLNKKKRQTEIDKPKDWWDHSKVGDPDNYKPTKRHYDKKGKRIKEPGQGDANIEI